MKLHIDEVRTLLSREGKTFVNSLLRNGAEVDFFGAVVPRVSTTGGIACGSYSGEIMVVTPLPGVNLAEGWMSSEELILACNRMAAQSYND